MMLRDRMVYGPCFRQRKKTLSRMDNNYGQLNQLLQTGEPGHAVGTTGVF